MGLFGTCCSLPAARHPSSSHADIPLTLFYTLRSRGTSRYRGARHTHTHTHTHTHARTRTRTHALRIHTLCMRKQRIQAEVQPRQLEPPYSIASPLTPSPYLLPSSSITLSPPLLLHPITSSLTPSPYHLPSCSLTRSPPLLHHYPITLAAHTHTHTHTRTRTHTHTYRVHHQDDVAGWPGVQA